MLNTDTTTEITPTAYANARKSAVEVSVMPFERKFKWFLQKKGKKKVTIFFTLSDYSRAWMRCLELPELSGDLIYEIIKKLDDLLNYEQDTNKHPLSQDSADILA